MKEFGGRWKWSKKRQAMVLIWKRRKVKEAASADNKPEVGERRHDPLGCTLAYQKAIRDVLEVVDRFDDSNEYPLIVAGIRALQP